MSKRNITVFKADGRRETFQEQKIIRSLKRANIPSEFIKPIIAKIKSFSKKEISTREINALILDYLRVHYPLGAVRFNLKQGIAKLGPSGYPFEKFLAKLLEEYGYQTEKNVFIQGKCALHEIDIIAKKEECYFIEAKYHNLFWEKTDLKIVLYVYARYLDISEFHKNAKIWVITNTKFTQPALKYGQCVGIKMTSWGYPQNESLENLVEKKKLYPITCLLSGNRWIFQKLINQGIILVNQLYGAEIDYLISLGISRQRAEIILKEIKVLKDL